MEQNAPQTPAPTSISEKTTSSLIDSALDFLSTESGDEKAGRDKGERRAEAEQPQEPGDAVQLDAAVDEGHETEADAEQLESESEEPEGDRHDTRGSKEEPFTVKDLPDDKFIELKVDGEKTVVPLSELAAGYLRERTFHQRLNKTQELSQKAEQLVTRAKETETKLRTELRTFLSSPDELFDFFLGSEDREQVFEQAAIRYAELRRRHRERPEERLAWQRERDRARLEAERRAFEESKQAELAQKQQAEANERAWAIFRPGWEEGLKQAGFPEPTRELYDEVMLRCRQQIERGDVVSSEDVAKFTLRAAKLLELKPKTEAKPKAPVVRKKEPVVERANGKRRDPYADMPAHKRRNDVDYFLRNLSPRDYR